jgi:hypothetical protein
MGFLMPLAVSTKEVRLAIKSSIPVTKRIEA